MLDWAAVRGLRDGDNPARWVGRLDRVLPHPEAVRPTIRQRALPYLDLGPFLAALRERQEIAARALEFLIMTAARGNEVLKAQWTEFNLQDKVWTIPACRMKCARAHTVPLSNPAVKILDTMAARRIAGHPFVFPGARRRVQIGNSCFTVLLTTKMNRRDFTAHGFRSTFRDWADASTSFDRELIELALGHAIGSISTLDHAGRRFAERRQLMASWAEFCTADRSSAAPQPQTASA